MKILYALLFSLLASEVSAQSVDLRTYWPQPMAGRQRIVQDKSPGLGMTVTRRFVLRGTVGGAPVYQLEEFGTGYHAIWEFRDVGGVIEEVGDWFGATHVVFVPGKSIPWGGVMNVGSYLDRSVEVDVAASSGVSSGPSNYGYQKVTLLTAPASFTNAGGVSFSNVVKINVFQAWCITWACSGPGNVNTWEVNYWMAPGQGFIQIEYVSGPGVTPRTDYSDAPLTTWETP